MNQSNIEGSFWGVAFGDALGIPVETWNADQIVQRYGRLTTYQPCENHKWMGDWPAGRWTDDTQLSLAVAESLIERRFIDLADIAQRHVKAMKESHKGWGGSTRDSVTRIEQGIPWNRSGSSTGAGNGVAMKIAPLAWYWYQQFPQQIPITSVRQLAPTLRGFGAMTHDNDLSVVSGAVQFAAVLFCLQTEPTEFDQKAFSSTLVQVSRWMEEYCRAQGMNSLPDRLSVRLEDLLMNPSAFQTPESIISTFGGGSCYCYDSLPFTYAFFLRDPRSVESMYEVVNAGGDTDSNGSMVGSLLGALNGKGVFPVTLKEGLWEVDRLERVVGSFVGI